MEKGVRRCALALAFGCLLLLVGPGHGGGSPPFSMGTYGLYRPNALPLEPGAVSNKPFLDGDLGEWSGFPLATLDRATASTMWGAAPERADLMGVLKWVWRPEGLYVGLHVRDDVLTNDSTDLAKDDVFELAIDGDDDGSLSGSSDHLYRITDDGRQSDRGATIKALTVGRRTVPPGWDLEIFFPASHLNLGTLAAGRPLRFNWALGDDDNGGNSDNRLFAYGTRLETPELAWPVVFFGNEPLAFTFPAETGRWEWTSGGTFNDIFFLDDLHGWAAGPGVWRTVDGGATWVRLPALAGADPRKIVFADRQRGWAQGAKNYVYRTEDGGETWELAARAGVLEPTPALARVGADDVWAAANAGGYCNAEGCNWIAGVVHSQDGGVTWTEEGYMFAQGQVADLDFLDPLHGFAVGNQDECPLAFAATVDGGVTWQVSCLPTGAAMIPGAVAFGSLTKGWVVATNTDCGASDGKVYGTNDGGKTWTLQASFTEPANWIQAQDAQRAWAGGGTTIYRTTDGGATWLPLVSPGPSRVMFSSSSVGWGIEGDTVRKTSDGGASWREVLRLPPAEARSWWLDHLTGWRASGSDIERTTDGGGSWQVASTGLAAIDEFQFVDARNGWAWHNETGVLVHTADGGATWDTQLAGASTLADLQFSDSRTGWVRGDGSQLLRTTDGGHTWHPVATAAQIGDRVQFVDRNHGWTYAFTCAGYADPPGAFCWTSQARSDDGGVHWTASGGPAEAAFYLDESRGWGIDYAYDETRYSDWCNWRYALETTGDGGRTWATLWQMGSTDCAYYPFAKSDVAAMYALDRERVWIWGPTPHVAAGPVAASTDGGAAWVSEPAQAAHLQDVRFDRTGAASARDNGTLHYRNTEIAAYRATRPPQIDGDLAEWAGVPAYGIKGADAMRVDGVAPVPLDGSALLQAAYDADNLYFALRVYDDALVLDSAGKPWLDDSVEFGLDGYHDHVRNWEKGDDRQFTVNAQGEQFESGSPAALLTVAHRTIPGGYLLEVAAPRAALANAVLAPKVVLGFNWLLSDDDDGGNYDSRLLWLGAGTYQADAGWGHLRLSELTAVLAALNTPTPTASPTATETSTVTPTATATATPTPTRVPTDTPTPPSATSTPRLFLPVIMR